MKGYYSYCYFLNLYDSLSQRMHLSGKNTKDICTNTKFYLTLLLLLGLASCIMSTRVTERTYQPFRMGFYFDRMSLLIRAALCNGVGGNS